MKKRSYSKLFLAFPILLLYMCFIGCRKDEEIDQLVNTGYFVVTNTSNGESLTIYGGEFDKSSLNSKNGDVIKMQYVPEEKYKSLNYNVSFTIHDNSTQEATAPYYIVEHLLANMAVGGYTVTMSAIVSEDGKQAITVASYTLVVKE